MYVVYNLCDSYHCISICLCRFEWWCPQMSEKECRAHLHIHGPFLSSSFCVLHTHIDTQTMLEQYEVSRAWWDFFVHRIHGRMLEKTFIKGFNTSRVFSWRIFFWTQTQVTSMHAYSIYTFFFILSHVVFAFINSYKQSLGKQPNTSIHLSILSFLEAISNKSQCNHGNLRVPLCALRKQPQLSEHVLVQIQMHILTEWVILNILNHKLDFYTFWGKKTNKQKNQNKNKNFKKAKKMYRIYMANIDIKIYLYIFQ